MQRFVYFKSSNATYRSMVLEAQPDPKAVAFLGSSSGMKYWTAKLHRTGGSLIDLAPDWHQLAFKVMLKTVRLKYQHNPCLVDHLLATGDKQLIEQDYENYWDAGEDKKNRFGRLLMKVRRELREAS